jgi:predicted ATPase/DNA-binding CsgD family transcriptional regulator
MPEPKLQIVPGQTGQRPRRVANPANNLPAQHPEGTRPLTGRERELGVAGRLLEEPDVRLLSLVGPGGVGKTRLALQLADEMLEQFEGGVFLVNLAPVSDPDLVVPTIATTLGVREAPGGPLISTLIEHLQGKRSAIAEGKRSAIAEGERMLLLLDNFEQVIPAGRSLAEILAACPHLKLLVTSREALRLACEHVLAVSPLALPEPGVRLSRSKLSKYGAIALFVQRARAVRPDFMLTDGNAAAVAEVCRRVDGLPLAIELVAPYARLLPPQSILARLTHPLRLLEGDAPDAQSKHRSMRDTIEWSYNLLTEQQQRLFRCMSVFVGGCALRAAEAVCNEQGDISVESDDPLAIEVLKSIDALVEKSLVRRLDQDEAEDPRFLMLETVREYALERLVASDEADATRRRHAAYYLALAQRIGPDIQSSDAPEWMGRLGPEHDNLRAALRYLLARDEAASYEGALHILFNLRGFWGRFDHMSAVQQWLEAALAGSDHRATPFRAGALRFAATVSYLRADYSRAETWAEQALAAARELDDQTLIPDTLGLMGLLAVFREDYERARGLLEEALDIYRRTGNDFGVGAVCINLGETVRYQGKYARAEAYYRESLRIFRALGRKVGALQALSNIGHMLLKQGDLPAARATFAEALGMAHETDARKIAAEALTGMAGVIIAELDMSAASSPEASASSAGQAYDDAAASAPHRKGMMLAAHILGITSGVIERSGRQLEPIDQAEFERSAASARDMLGEEAFAAALEEGRAMTLEQAIDLVSGPEATGTGRRSRDTAPRPHPGDLTARQIEIALLVAGGLSNEDIARDLVISERTVEMHVSHALHRLGLSTRTQLAAWAIRQGVKQTRDA